MEKSSELKEIPPPQEKLLRPPTFTEKYGRVKVAIIAAIIVVIIDILIYKFLIVPDFQNPIPPPTQQESMVTTITPSITPKL